MMMGTLFLCFFLSKDAFLQKTFPISSFFASKKLYTFDLQNVLI